MFLHTFLIQLGTYNSLSTFADNKANQMWAKYFYAASSPTGGGIFGYVCDAVLPIALLCALFNYLQQVKAYQTNREDFKLVTGIIIPSLICLSLVSQGPVLKVGIGALRDISNNITYSVLLNFEAATQTDNTLKDSIGSSETLQKYRDQAVSCGKQVSNGESRRLCYQKLRDDINADRTILRLPGLGKVTDLANAITTALSNVDPLAALDTVVGTVESLNPINILATGIINAVMSAIAAAIKTGLEISFLLTAFIAPLFIAIAPLEQGWKALISWLSGFWSLFIFRFSYSIIIALAGTLYTNQTGAFEFQLSIFSALVAPVLAGVLAGGGGLGFYNAAVSATGKLITTVVRII
jgi:hypothetical protein